MSSPTFSAQPLKDLVKFVTAQGGTPSVARDCSDATRNQYGYHFSRWQIVNCGVGLAKDYSVETVRDKAGLSESRSAIDITFGPLRMQRFSRRLVELCQANAPGTSDIREVIYSPDGTTVLRYDRERGVASAPREGEAAQSHTGHTHISFYRDAEARDKVGPIAAALGIVTTPPVPPIVPAPGDEPVTPEQVKQLQQTLNSLGWSPALVVDGIYGPKTEAAVAGIRAVVDSAKSGLVSANEALKSKLVAGKVDATALAQKLTV